jgi:hypothetical protein
MPNFDGGHYFLTGLYPVRLEPEKRPDGSITVPSHLLRETLASLPNFSQIPGVNRTSPFARCRSTHFARFAVIDDPAWNGRDPVDALKGALKGVDLSVHQPVDHLSRAWLIMTVDFDAPDGSAESRDRWARDLWGLMEPELRAIFSPCVSFRHVDSAETFARYIARGQIETTMSFNDYWIDPMPAEGVSMKRIGLQIVGVLLLFLAAAWLIDREIDRFGWLVWVAAAILGLAAGAYAAYKLIMSRGARPFPTAPNSDLKSVLKGLYLQQNFTRFAIAQQGAAPDALHAAFGRFLAEVRPADLDKPTQPPGVLQS